MAVPPDKAPPPAHSHSATPTPPPLSIPPSVIIPPPPSTGHISYASAVQRQGTVPAQSSSNPPPLGGVSLPHRAAISVDDAPAVLFTPQETQACHKQLEFTVVLKFSAVRPHLQIIQEHISKVWHLKGSFIVGLMDPRHVMGYLTSGEDLNLALSKESHMISNYMFRCYRWSPDLSFKFDSSFVAVWVRLHRLPLHLFAPAALRRIGNGLGYFLRADDRTLAFTHPSYARICVEVDVASALPEKIWIGESKDIGYFQPIVWEGNTRFCVGCGLLGHNKDECRKASKIFNSRAQGTMKVINMKHSEPIVNNGVQKKNPGASEPQSKPVYVRKEQVKVNLEKPKVTFVTPFPKNNRGVHGGGKGKTPFIVGSNNAASGSGMGEGINFEVPITFLSKSVEGNNSLGDVEPTFSSHLEENGPQEKQSAKSSGQSETFLASTMPHVAPAPTFHPDFLISMEVDVTHAEKLQEIGGDSVNLEAINLGETGHGGQELMVGDDPKNLSHPNEEDIMEDLTPSMEPTFGKVGDNILNNIVVGPHANSKEKVVFPFDKSGQNDTIMEPHVCEENMTLVKEVGCGEDNGSHLLEIVEEVGYGEENGSQLLEIVEDTTMGLVGLATDVSVVAGLENKIFEISNSQDMASLVDKPTAPRLRPPEARKPNPKYFNPKFTNTVISNKSTSSTSQNPPAREVAMNAMAKPYIPSQQLSAPMITREKCDSEPEGYHSDVASSAFADAHNFGGMVGGVDVSPWAPKAGGHSIDEYYDEGDGFIPVRKRNGKKVFKVGSRSHRG